MSRGGMNVRLANKAEAGSAKTSDRITLRAFGDEMD